MIVIPAIDIIDGKCVRLEQGLYNRSKVYYDDPVEVALRFEQHGIRRLHLVDLDGSRSHKVLNWRVLEQIARSTSMVIDFGGGIKQVSDLDIVFNHGASQATVGSIAAEDPDLFHLWLEIYGPERLILGADIKNGQIATRGWLESSNLGWQHFLDMHLARGVRYVISTAIEKDGMLQGPAYLLYEDMLQTYPDILLIASGGVTSQDDLYRLRELGCYGAIIGKALYEGNITLDQLKPFL